MDKIVTVVENGGLAKNHILLADLKFFLNPLYPLEENQLYIARTISQDSNQPGGFARPGQGDALDCTAQLNIGAGRIYLFDSVELAAVNVTEREGVQQVTEAFYTKFLLQKLGPLGTYPRQKLDFAVQYIPGHSNPKVK